MKYDIYVSDVHADDGYDIISDEIFGVNGSGNLTPTQVFEWLAEGTGDWNLLITEHGSNEVLASLTQYLTEGMKFKVPEKKEED